ncbi:arginase family protein [Agarivorans sp. B2Z047]|uniref:arginase family protein n=1 Tax=Agarivorans sp. B2Z047 TaxID=2652721 RepID=UPI001884499B|nr:arginase family protein [Agarivorans sp. B2Z047]UQN41940.1 arginase family protein [Agarivorans sp. B2Z047]
MSTNSDRTRNPRSSTGFARLEISNDTVSTNSKYILFGVASDVGGTYPGQSMNGPNLIRAASKSLCWRDGNPSSVFTMSREYSQIFENNRVVDIGNIHLTSNTSSSAVEELYCRLKELPSNAVRVMLGGDHSLTYANVADTYERRNKGFKYIHIDSHLDTQLKGDYSNGKPTKLQEINHSNFVSHLSYNIPSIEFLHLGIDHFQCTELGNIYDVKRYLGEMGTQVSSFDLMVNGCKVLDELLIEGEDIYLSIDVDSINACYISCTPMPSVSGIDLHLLVKIVSYIKSKANIIGFDIMEFGCPRNAVDSKTKNEATLISQLISFILE